MPGRRGWQGDGGVGGAPGRPDREPRRRRRRRRGRRAAATTTPRERPPPPQRPPARRSSSRQAGRRPPGRSSMLTQSASTMAVPLPQLAGPARGAWAGNSSLFFLPLLVSRLLAGRRRLAPLLVVVRAGGRCGCSGFAGHVHLHQFGGRRRGQSLPGGPLGLRVHDLDAPHADAFPHTDRARAGPVAEGGGGGRGGLARPDGLGDGRLLLGFELALAWRRTSGSVSGTDVSLMDGWSVVERSGGRPPAFVPFPSLPPLPLSLTLSLSLSRPLQNSRSRSLAWMRRLVALLFFLDIDCAGEKGEK